MSAVAEDVLDTSNMISSEIDQLESIENITPAGVISLTDFVQDFGDGLLEAVQNQNPPVYNGQPDPVRKAIMDGLLRKPFPAQQDAVQAMCSLLLDTQEKSVILNAEMGTGKTIMGIAASAVMHAEGYQRILIISPPHLVYKWQREIKETVDNARVWILNGSDTLAKLLMLRNELGQPPHYGPEYFILGRVRMRMGFHWVPAYMTRNLHVRKYTEVGNENSQSYVTTNQVCACPRCGTILTVDDAEGTPMPVSPGNFPDSKRINCHECHEPLWTLIRKQQRQRSRRELVADAMCQIPTIGPKTADKLLSFFGEDMLGGMLSDNVYEFINLMDENGDLVFSDKQARRMERAMANLEFSFGQGGYQPTEFIKRYLPGKYFDLMIADEAHELKNESAQGQAMGVLANKVRKIILLTGTLMGGYGDDLFYLLFRVATQRMIEDGYAYNTRGTLGSASTLFMREHGVLKDIYTESEGDNHKTARGKRITVRTSKAPGFGPEGVCRYILPYTVFLKLKDIGGNILPPYDEKLISVPMSPDQADVYTSMRKTLEQELKEALRKGDNSLLGVVMNALLAWPDTCFREEHVKHPRTRASLFYTGSVFDESEMTPKEEECLRLCKQEKARGRRTLVYSVYTGKRDTTARLKQQLEREGLKVAVLRASVSTSKREDWIFEQVDRGIDVLITNPELVKTGLDLLDFPSIVFMQSGYNVYTVLQAARRSWRIGQKNDVVVYFLGYEDTAQVACLSLMAQKIAVSQSTSGDMPDTGLDVLNQDGDSIEVALAKQLLAA